MKSEIQANATTYSPCVLILCRRGLHLIFPHFAPLCLSNDVSEVLEAIPRGYNASH